MKKALIVTALAGFIRTFLMNDIKTLQKMGYEIHCAANKNHSGVGAEGIVEYLNKNHVIFHQIDFSSNKPISLHTCKSYIQLKVILKNENFDFVHCHTPIVGVICRLACIRYRKRGMKVVYTTHGFYFHKGSSKKTWIIYKNIETIFSYFSDAIITINKEDYNNAKKMHCSNVYYINGVGVDIKKFRNVEINREAYRKSIGVENHELVVLMIGELSKRKNHKIVIDAVAQLKISNLVVVHCGNSMNGDEIEISIRDTALKNNIKLVMLGIRDDIPQICKCADIGTISSTREGLGLAGIEMLASGLPIVASKVHGILDYVQDGVNGYLADPYNVMEFSEGIRKLLAPEIREKMYHICQKSVDKFDVNVSKQQMKAIYRQILE